jgi:hypothetical protein
MPLTQEQQELLERLRTANQEAGFPFTAGPHWQRVNSMFDQWLEENGIGDVIHQRFNDHYAGLPPVSRQAQWGDFIKRQMRLLPDSKNICHLLTALLDEKGCNYHRTVAGFCESRDLPWDLLTASESLFFMKKAGLDVTDAPVRVLDLGGGWGRMGCALRILNRQAVYIQCDLPESLLISLETLPKMLKEPAGAPVEEFDLDAPGIYFISPQTILDVPDGGLDLVVNIASFQEMQTMQIEAYLSLIKCKAAHLYSLQSWTIDKTVKVIEYSGWTTVEAAPVLWAPNYSQALFSTE